jgi:FKBP-type peptidyl-prolyl cis-trans isomerase FkpA/FKBP-type peptidyl-prolyl cis-trans isomerase FklB
MKFQPFAPRHALVLTLAAVALVAGCNKTADKAAADKTAPAAASTAAGATIAGLPTDKDQVSYMVGMALAKQLEPMKDEIDVDTISKAIKTSLAGEKLLLTEEQAREIGESFGQKMQAKQIAKMMADAKSNLEAGQKFFAENGKKPGVQTTASGLQYQVLTEGKGAKPKAGDAVRVHYKGALLDGKTFDSSYDRGQPVVFPIEQVVPGWQEGLQLMPVGSKYKLWIPGNLGYGDKGTPGGPIPPNATLVFEVELLDIVKGGAPGANPAG